MRIKHLLTCLLISSSAFVFAQNDEPKKEDKGELSGNFQTTNQFYVKDDKIGATTTQYQRELSSTDAWLYLNYKYSGYNFNLRYDLFNNSPLLNPQEAYTASGLGFWSISKNINKLNVTIGSFYDQFGTGTIFRSFEDRNLGIDYAIQGARVIWTPNNDTKIKAFTGRQKYRFDIRPEVIKGINAERHFQVNENLGLDVGASAVNRTIDPTTMANIAAAINNYDLKNRFDPTYNVYGFNAYNTLSYKRISLYTEYCYKTPEAVLNSQLDRMQLLSGKVYYASLSYSTKGIGINTQFKKIESFSFRTSPLEIQNLGLITYLPSITRQNTYRLLARYNAVAQELGENAAQVEVSYKPQTAYFKKHMTTVNINVSVVTGPQSFNFDGNALNLADFNSDTSRYFREYYIDISHKFNKKFKMLLGYQNINYNQRLFENKAQGTPYVLAQCIFGEATYKLTPTKSVRMEAQYLDTKQDYGSFVNALIEFNVAPHYSFSAGDMLNISKGYINAENFEQVHYWNVFGAYTFGPTRFTAGFIKQVAGVNCTGGVCRVEPAFSGARVTLTTNF
ncbi:MAG: DUF6029 family protein [Bacteroidota bacterium]